VTVSELCQSCGLCCEGTLFRFVGVTAEEADRLERAGVPSFRRKRGGLAIRLACRALAGTRCGIYPLRPANCAGYWCALALAVLRGEVSSEAAAATVFEAKERLRRIERLLPPRGADEPTSVLQRARNLGLPDGPGLLREFDAFLDTHFTPPQERVR
jgi:Fe-S-cluster containining protein